MVVGCCEIKAKVQSMENHNTKIGSQILSPGFSTQTAPLCLFISSLTLIISFAEWQWRMDR